MPNIFADKRTLASAKQPMNFWDFSQKFNFANTNGISPEETTTAPNLDKPINTEKTLPYAFENVAMKINKINNLIEGLKADLSSVNKDGTINKTEDQKKALVEAYKELNKLNKCIDAVVEGISAAFTNDKPSEALEKLDKAEAHKAADQRK